MQNDTCQHEDELAAGLENAADPRQALLEIERQLQSREIECDMRSARIKDEEREARELKARQEANYAEQVRKVEELATELRKERELLNREREEMAQLRQVHEALFSKSSAAGQQERSEADSAEYVEGSSGNDETGAERVNDLAVQEEEEQIEEELLEEEFVEVEEPVEPEPERRQAARASNGAPDEDQSIEDYMAGLLKRMRGGAPAPAAVAPEPKRNKRKSDPLPPEEQPKAHEKAHVAARVQQVVDMPMGLTELTRRTQPAQMTSYAAMRELANNQARIAIDTHGKKELLKATLINSGLAVACFIGTLCVFIMMPSDIPGLRTGSMAILIGGVYWLYEAIVAGQALCAEVPVIVRPGDRNELEAVEVPPTA